MLTLADIDSMTKESGEGWGYAHVQRVLALTRIVGAELVYDEEILTWAVYLHDWGAFPKYRIENTPHALRSRQVVESEILPQVDFSSNRKNVLLESIEKHDYQDQRPVDSQEALILREADWLDMLGVIGIVRDFAWGPNNLQICYDRILKHIELIEGRFTIPIAQKLAKERIKNMKTILDQLIEESFEWL